MALVADTGSSSTDQITSNPAIKGTGQANTLVTIKEGGVTLGTATADGTGAWSFTPGLADGAHTLTASQTASDGSIGTATLSFTLDSSAPVVSVALVADTGSSSTDRITSNPAIKGTGQANTLVTITEGGVTLGTTMADATGAWSFTPNGLADGAHTFSASQTDLAGNTGTATLSFTLDSDGAGGERGAGRGHRQLVGRPDYLQPGDQGHGSGQHSGHHQGRRRHARYRDGGRHRSLELHARSGRWRAHADRQPDRQRRQHRDGNAELHARQVRRRW